jgi:alkaline phosphatase D
MKYVLIFLSLIPIFAFGQNLEAPFYHGVASGDPLADAVIIWTRVTPVNVKAAGIKGRWFVATDAEMMNVVKEGGFITDASKDFTVKIDVTDLESNTYYYYQFRALGKMSIIGRTKTAPKANESDHLRFAVVSCNHFQHGYFNGFNALSEMHDLDAVIHLGDYIYEYEERDEFMDKVVRHVSPVTEIFDLQDYRMRYSNYRLDMDFIKVHQQHPFICIWDDHETANDSYKDGAQNHQKNEGDWEKRKAAAKQAYFEWLPIRNHPDKKINRTLKFGNLADLILLDTRLEGRDKKPATMFDENYHDSTRTILGENQRNWLFEELKNSEAQWKLIGQQVIFSELNVGWANPLDKTQLEDYFLDIWDGYPADRQRVINFIEKEKLDNIVFLTGDFHSSFANEVTANPLDENQYNPMTGSGAVAVEFVTPSITSSNFDEAATKYRARKVEQCLIKPCWFPFLSFSDPNPHIKYADLDRNGFMLLDITKEKVQSDFYYVSTIYDKNYDLYYQLGFFTKNKANHLEINGNPASNKIAAILAPTFEVRKKEVFITGVHVKEDSIYVQISKDAASLDLFVRIKNVTTPDIVKGKGFITRHSITTTIFPKSELPPGLYVVEIVALKNHSVLEVDEVFFRIME